MKRRLQMILGLLSIAITISMIAVTVGWYSAAGGDVVLEGTTVSVSTSSNDYYGSSTNITCEGLLTIGEDGIYTAKPYESYVGQLGISNETYILLFKAENSIYCSESSGYVNSCIISAPSPMEYKYVKPGSETGEDLINPFRVAILSKNDDGTFSVSENAETVEYFAVIFGDGTTRFPFSYSEYKGTTFKINVYFEN